MRNNMRAPSAVTALSLPGAALMTLVAGALFGLLGGTVLQPCADSNASSAVCGDEDQDNGSARDLADLLPDAIYVEVPGTHLISATKPEMGEAIVSFLAN
mgnify:CR=1 FL=1